MEWINPNYADIVATMRRADAQRREEDPTAPRVRGFVLPKPPADH